MSRSISKMQRHRRLCFNSIIKTRFGTRSDSSGTRQKILHSDSDLRTTRHPSKAQIFGRREFRITIGIFCQLVSAGRRHDLWILMSVMHIFSFRTRRWISPTVKDTSFEEYLMLRLIL